MAAGREQEMAFGTDGKLHVARLRVSAQNTTGAAASLSPGTYVVTGGLGGLGLRAASLLASKGAERVLLASSSGRIRRKAQGLEARLSELSAAAVLVACDSGDAADVRALVGQAQALSGLLHAAGVSDKGLLAAVDAARLEWVLAP
jgi:NAD(P)-dependent dehydrogenase (short-subunit alcohol dehydrogenase family)